jgi:DNA-binding response OmpR family regulator
VTVHRGIDDYLAKPIDVDELARRITAAVRLLEGVGVVEGVREALRGRSSRRLEIGATPASTRYSQGES